MHEHSVKVLVLAVAFLAASSSKGAPVNDVGSSLRRLATLPVEKLDNRAFETEILQLFERLRDLMKNGDPENGISPFEPIVVGKVAFDFYLEETELNGYLRNAVFANLSDFQIRNLTVNVFPKIEVKLKADFDQIALNGSYKLLGSLFGDLPIDGVGSYRILLKNSTIEVDGFLRSKAGVLQFRELNAKFDIRGASVMYTNILESQEEKQLEEKFALDVLDRFQVECLPPLLNTLKVVLNDFLVRLAFWNDKEMVRHLLSFVNV